MEDEEYKENKRPPASSGCLLPIKLLGTQLGMRRPLSGYTPRNSSLPTIISSHHLKRRGISHIIAPRPLKLKMDPHAIDKIFSVQFKVPTFTRPLGGGSGSVVRSGSNLGMRKIRNIKFEALHGNLCILLSYRPRSS
jgi:hypothetical protein